MAVSVTIPDVALAIRAAANVDDIPPQISTVIRYALAAAMQCVLDYAPNAPDAVHDAATIRVCGWLYEADPTDSRISRVLEVSGAQSLLAPYRVHRAAAVGGMPSGETPAPSPPSSELPPYPDDGGTYILSLQGATLVWLPFPVPS